MPLLGLRRRVPRGVRIIPVDRDAIDATSRRYHAMICNGRSKPAKRPLSGNNGLVELDLADRGGRDLFECFEDWVIQYGMPHHVIICQGHHKASLVKFAAARGVKVV